MGREYRHCSGKSHHDVYLSLPKLELSGPLIEGEPFLLREGGGGVGREYKNWSGKFDHGVFLSLPKLELSGPTH